MKKELLAPAGDIEAGYAALYYGADAVYLGLQQFSARATAANFDEKALNEFTAYAHSLQRKVYVALNTLLQECELSDLLKNLDICSKCRVDALIVQDLGVAHIVKEQYPELELHASTQMAVHNKEGALALQKAGFTRVVLARELTLAEIKEIAALPGLETEAFIHGALCYSYSGLCQFSTVESGRSANRGKCLYPCRAKFGGEDGARHYFSMKDMALQEDVLKMPVTSLKIEGRKKTALYVAAVTDYYRQILDGKKAEQRKEENIKQIFSRPWCKFHFNGRSKEIIDRDFVGHRGLKIGEIERIDGRKITFKASHLVCRYDGIQIEIPGQEKPFGFSLQVMRVNGKNVFEAKKGEQVEIMLPLQMPLLKKGYAVYLASATEVKGAYDYNKPKPGEFKQRQPLSVRFEVRSDTVCAEAEGKKAEIKGNWQTAVNIDKMNEAVHKAFAKSGETEFKLEEIEIANKQNYFVPISVLNELRRQLYEQIEVVSKRGILPQIIPHKTAAPQWIIKTDNPESLAQVDLDSAAEIIFLLNPKSDLSALGKFPKEKIRFALPAVCRKVAEFVSLIDKLIEQGYQKWEIGNYWGLSVLPEKGIDLSFDTSLYVLNTQAMAMAQKMGAARVSLAIEDTCVNLQEIAAAAPLKTCLCIYQDAPLFTSAACIRSNPCRECRREEKWSLLNKDGNHYEVLSKDCQTMLFAEKALCFAKEAPGIRVDYYRADFVYKPYSAQKVKEIWEQLQKFQDVENTQKANLCRDKNF